MSNYPRNDWRDYLAHSWGTEPKQKAREKEYNAEYYQNHKEKWGVGNTNTKTNKSDPDWLKNYMSAIEKMRKSTGNDNWLPGNIDDFKSWYKELISNYPGISMSQAKEAWNQVQRTLSGDSSDSEEQESKSGKSSGGGSSKGSSSKTDSKDEEKPKKSKETIEALADLAKNYRIAYNAKSDTDSYKYSLKNEDVDTAFDSFDEFVAEMIELGAVEEEITMDDWEEFKSKDPRKRR